MTDAPTPLSFRLDRACLLLLVLAIALPIRVNMKVGPFTTFSALDAVLITCTIVAIGRFMMFGTQHLGPRLLGWVIAIPVLIAWSSVVWAKDPSLSIIASVKYVYSALCYFVAFGMARSSSMKRMSAIFGALFACWLAGSVGMYIGLPGFEYFIADSVHMTQAETYDLLASLYTRLAHPYLGLSNDYGPLLVLVGFITYGVGRQANRKLFRIVGLLAIAASLLTFSRGLLIGLVVSAIYYLILIRVQVKTIFRLLAICSFIGFAVWGGMQLVTIELEDRNIDTSDIVESRLSESNIESRIEGYLDAARMIADRPFFGYGAGYYDRALASASVATHNAYLEQLKYFGVIFGALTAFCYVAVFLYLRRLRFSNPSTAELSNGIACGWLFLVVASLGETFFEATVPRAIIFVMLGLGVGMLSAATQTSGKFGPV